MFDPIFLSVGHFYSTIHSLNISYLFIAQQHEWLYYCEYGQVHVSHSRYVALPVYLITI
jgi:hypothetical protein